MHISLTPELESRVRAKVDSGLYNNASEVVREALRFVDEHAALVEQIKLDYLNGGVTQYRKINNETEKARVAAMHKALKALQKMGTAEKFGDPVEWQQNTRLDRALPGRD